MSVLNTIGSNQEREDSPLPALTVRDIGERGLLARLQHFCPPDIVGDDAAVLEIATDQSLVVTTDVLVDGVHFSDRTTSPADVGWRAAAANLSDLAAMGATPIGVTVGLTLPGHLPIAWVEALYEGLTACLQPYRTPIVGGDICRSNVMTVAIAAFGQVNPAQAIRRSTAQPGDAILVTGIHGASKAGLELLLNPDAGEGLSEGDRTTLIQAHQRPIPRLDVIPIVQQLAIGSYPSFPVAGMDSSDGLADAILQLCHASRVGACIERHQILIPEALTHWVSPDQALEWVLYGGEDFELVLCLPLTIAQPLAEQLGNNARIIGSITADPAVVLHDPSGIYPDEMLSLSRGFQHF